MEESYETFEEELGSHRQPPQAGRQVRRPEMYAARRMKEESPVPTIQQQVPKTLMREPSLPPARSMSLRKAMSMQNLSQVEGPWESVTLNRCLLVAITILVLTSGFHRIHEMVRGRRGVEEEEEVGLTLRPSALRHKSPPPKPEASLWEVLFSWLPDFNNEDDKRGKAKRGAREKTSSSLRNKRQPERRLTKDREGTIKDRRSRKEKDEETRGKKREKEKRAKLREEEEEDEDEEDEDVMPKKKAQREEKKEKKSKTRKS